MMLRLRLVAVCVICMLGLAVSWETPCASPRGVPVFAAADDGSRLAVAARAGSSEIERAYLVQVRSGASKRVDLPRWAGRYHPREWSPDATLVVGTWSSPTYTEWGIAVLAADSGEFAVVTRSRSGEGEDGIDLSPSWSPSGRWIAVERVCNSSSGTAPRGIWVVSRSGSQSIEIARGRFFGDMWRSGGFAWDDTTDTLYWVDDCNGKQSSPVLHTVEVSQSGKLRSRDVVLDALGKAERLDRARIVPRPAGGKVLVDTHGRGAAPRRVWLADLKGKGKGKASITLESSARVRYTPLRLVHGERLLALEWRTGARQSQAKGTRVGVVQYDLATRQTTHLLPPQSQHLRLVNLCVPPSGRWLYWSDDPANAVYRTPLTAWKPRVLWADVALADE